MPHPAFSGAQKRAELLRNPYFLGDPQKEGIDMAHIGPVQKGLWGRSLRALLNKKKTSRPLRTALARGPALVLGPAPIHPNAPMKYALRPSFAVTKHLRSSVKRAACAARGGGGPKRPNLGTRHATPSKGCGSGGVAVPPVSWRPCLPPPQCPRTVCARD